MKGTLRKLNLSANRMATKEAGVILGNMLIHNSNLRELNVSNNSESLNSKGEWIRDCSYDGPGFAEGLSKGLSRNQVLSVLNVARNSLCGICEYGQGKYNATGIVALSHAVKHNVRTIPPVPCRSFQHHALSTAVHLAKGSLSEFTFDGYFQKCTSHESCSMAITLNASMTDADCSEKGLGISGAILLAAFLPKCK
jgi:hypothetical protein